MTYKSKVAFANNANLETVICKAFSHKEDLLQEIARDDMVYEVMQQVIYNNRGALQMLSDYDHKDFKKRKYEGSAT